MLACGVPAFCLRTIKGLVIQCNSANAQKLNRQGILLLCQGCAPGFNGAAVIVFPLVGFPHGTEFLRDRQGGRLELLFKYQHGRQPGFLLERQVQLNEALDALGDDDAREDAIRDELDDLQMRLEARFRFFLDGPDGPQPLQEFRLESATACFLRFE